MLRGLSFGLATAAALAVAIPQAQAFPPAGTPTTTNPGLLNGSGLDSKAIYVFSDAGDTSNMSMTIPPFGFVFANHANGSHPANSAGDTVDLGALGAGIQFGLDNISTGTSFLTNVADGGGDYHAFYTNNYLDFGEGPLPAAAAAAIAASGASVVTFVGWEDLTAAQGSDFDYNDLIFAFTNLTPTSAPEPATLALLGRV